ncbi:MAG: YhfC family glutamic-type intramembrane protease [Candidatus Njordarchaeales archaeon]
MEYFIAIFSLIVLALLPWLLYFIWYSRLKAKYVKFFLIGGIGWLLALLARTPILMALQLMPNQLVQGVIASLLAGIFEECFRFFFIQKFLGGEFSSGNGISFGVGWGVFEIILMHTLNLIVLLVIISLNISIPGQEIPPPDELFIGGLVGVYERIVVTTLHVGLTLVIIHAIKNRLWLYFAITYHFLVDFVAVTMAITLETTLANLWLIEGVITLLVIILYVIILKVLRVRLSRAFMDTSEELLPIFA